MSWSATRMRSRMEMIPATAPPSMTRTAPTPRATIRLAASPRRSSGPTVRRSRDMWLATTDMWRDPKGLAGKLPRWMTRGTSCEARTQGASICRHIGATEDAASRGVTPVRRPGLLSGQALTKRPRDQDLFEVLALAAPRSAVHVAQVAVLEAQAGGRQDAVVEVAAVVDNDHDPAAAAKRCTGAGEDGRDAFAVARHATADLRVVPPREAEELEGVGVLLVVVDQPRVGRRRDDQVDGTGRIRRARIGVEHRRIRARADVGVLVHALDGVAHVAAQELVRLPDRAAGAAVLVAEVLPAHRLGGEVEVVVAGEPRGAGGAGEHDAPEVG